ncbi:hypothetical protein SKAU_G00392580 [Synaphobranchus kaupii]|uniref:Uncharacterized protein n=1 Tax=Synaphobranchus kaupii TaxID=118154 RepID=A0A9Q1EBY2_SYNKA|nr:hypothetical protein SKAU_G00392580 [Synaphobranchus kaupii]
MFHAPAAFRQQGDVSEELTPETDRKAVCFFSENPVHEARLSRRPPPPRHRGKRAGPQRNSTRRAASAHLNGTVG